MFLNLGELTQVSIPDSFSVQSSEQENLEYRVLQTICSTGFSCLFAILRKLSVELFLGMWKSFHF